MSNSRPTTAREMTKKQLAEFREAFDLFDLNRDNKISKDELGKVMESLGMKPTKQELKDMMDNADADGSNFLEFNEFLNLMIKRFAGDEDRQAELKQAFKIFDKNGDSFISRSELKSAMRKMGEKMNDRDIDLLIKQVDLDRDGKVNYEEFVNVMHGH